MISKNLFLSLEKLRVVGKKECRNKSYKIVVDSRREVSLGHSDKMTPVFENLPVNYNSCIESKALLLCTENVQVNFKLYILIRSNKQI